MLLDTHAFIWFVFDSDRLSELAARTIEEADLPPVLSMTSIWEIGIKTSLGKLKLGMAFDEFVSRHIMGTHLELLPIEVAHISENTTLPLHHRDPFDRMLIAQARVAGLPVVTADGNFPRYGVHTIW